MPVLDPKPDVATIAPPPHPAERGAPSRLLPGLGLLAATLVLGAGPVLAQTVTISPTGSVNVMEGAAAVAITVTVADVPQDTTKARLGLLTIQKTGGVTAGDFNLYDSDPSMGSPTPLSLLDAPNASFPHIYRIQWNETTATNIPTSGTFNYWLEVPDDNVLEGPEALQVSFAIHGSGVATPTAESVTLTINVILPAPTGKPTTPANLMAAAGRGGEIRLTWDAIDATGSNTNVLNDVQITKHQYRQSTDGGANYGTWADIPNSAYGEANAAGYTIRGLIDGTEYTFQVRAVNGCTTTAGCGESDPSSSVTGTPGPTDKPTTPSNLTATPGRGAVTLTWDAIDDTSSNTNVLNDVQITKHQVRQSTDGGANYGTWTDIPDSAYGEANAARYTIRGLIDDTEYTFQVRAVNGCTTTAGCGESDPATAAAWPHSPDRYRISTIAGGVGDRGPATEAQFDAPFGVAADQAGNIYFSDSGGHRVRKVDSAGVITTFAGTGQFGFSGDGGPATAARLNSPRGLAFDAAGNLYIADTSNRWIRKVDTMGNITIFAGTRSSRSSGDGGPATEAAIGLPVDVAVDGSGNVYITDSQNDRIRKVDSSGTITTFAGTGTAGFSGDGGPADEAEINDPEGVAVDGSGNVYIADTLNNRIRKVDSSGVITTFAGTGSYGFSGDGGQATAARLRRPEDVAVDGSGNIYIADSSSHRVRKVDSAGVITTFAGTGQRGIRGDGGPATSANIQQPVAIALDGSGNLYIADLHNDRIRKVDSSGIITTVALGDHTFGGDGGRATSALLNRPYDVALDGSGNVYIADTFNERIRKVDSSGTITTFAGTGTAGFSGDGGPATEAQLNRPIGVAVDGSGNLYIADGLNYRIRKVDSSGVITTFAGSRTTGDHGYGGPATEARLYNVNGLAFDRSGNLYIVDPGVRRILKVDSSGIITNFAGFGGAGFRGNGGPATDAQFDIPTRVAVDRPGNVYIADSNNHQIRKVDSSGTITAFAGTGTFGFRGDGGPATAAGFQRPYGVALDRAGNVYITERLGHRVRKVDSSGLISTIAGTRSRGFGGDGGPATEAQFYEPRGIAVDGSGNIYIADTINHRVRKLTPVRPPPSPPPPPSRPDRRPRPNRHPTVTLSCAPCEVERGGEAMLTATASDPDGDPLTYAWSASDGVITGAGDTAAVRWTAPARSGTVTIRVKVSDGEGGSDAARVAIEVLLVLPERTPFDIPDRGTATFTTGGQADSPRVGYGLIRADGGMSTPSGIALFQFRDSQGVLITEASAPAAEPVRRGRIFAEVGNSVNTAVAFANPNGRPVDISFYLTDTAGSRTAEGSFTLEAFQHLAGPLNAPPFEVAGVVGTFSFRASAPLAVIALRGAANQAGEWLGTTLPVTPLLAPPSPFSEASTDPVVFPHFADGQGWDTQVILVNPTPQPIAGTLEFLGPDAAPLRVTLDDGRMGASFPYSIAAHSAWRVVTANPAEQTTSGSVRATPASGLPPVAAPFGLLLYSFTDGGKTVSQVGVPALPSSTAFRVPIAAAQPGQPGSIRTGLAVANTADAASTVSLEIIRPDGYLLVSPASLVLPPGGQTTRLLDQVFNLPQDFSSGLLRVSASNGKVSVAALRFRVNQRGELKTTAIWPRDEIAPATSEDRYFAHLADSGGWTTELILFSGTAGETGSGTLSLFWFPIE